MAPFGNMPVAWGAALWLEVDCPDQTLCVYGMQNGQQLNVKVPDVARVGPALGYPAVADTNNSTVWDEGTWVPDSPTPRSSSARHPTCAMLVTRSATRSATRRSSPTGAAFTC